MADSSTSPRLQVCLDLVADFIQHCRKLSRIKGYSKLEKKCRAEMKFLKSLHHKNATIQENHLRSSNLNHYAGILYMSECLPQVTSILQPFSVQSRITGSLVVDIVCNHGLTWVKVIARKAQALHLVWAGKGQFGDRDLMCQAHDYLRCASQHPVNYIVPKVHFVFFNAITEPMTETLEQLGIKVWGDIVPVEEDTKTLLQSVEEVFRDSSDSDSCGTVSDEEEDGEDREPCPDPLASISTDPSKIDTQSSQAEETFAPIINKLMQDLKDVSKKELSQEESLTNDSRYLAIPFAVQRFFNLQKMPLDTKTPTLVPLERKVETEGDHHVSHITRVNLDITTLITLVSAVSHGRCHLIFPEKILTMQAEEERVCPVLPRLLNFMEGKKLYTCQTAVSDFETILGTLGGKSERERAKELMSRVEIVPDQPSERSRSLPVTGKLKKRSKIIFGTGDQLHAITMTANSGYVRAAENHGVSFSVFLHASRALTEMKEKTAKPLNTESQQQKLTPEKN